MTSLLTQLKCLKGRVTEHYTKFIGRYKKE